jgi:hypothetical protein
MILGQPDGDKGYITTGSNGNDMTFTWEYDFATDLWLEKTPYEGTARTGAVGFTLGTGAVGVTLVGNVPKIAGTSTTRGFIATGINQGYTAGFQDCEEFFPAQTYNAYD